MIVDETIQKLIDMKLTTMVQAFREIVDGVRLFLRGHAAIGP